jgi:hypothetical protein
VAPFISTNVVALSVAGVIASLNVAVTAGFLGTPVAAFAGPVDVTVGAALVGLLGVLPLHAAASTATDAHKLVRRFICVSWQGLSVVAGDQPMQT